MRILNHHDLESIKDDLTDSAKYRVVALPSLPEEKRASKEFSSSLNCFFKITSLKSLTTEGKCASALSTQAHALIHSSSVPFLFFLNGFG